MATGIITPADFTGEFAITSDQFNNDKLQSYIDDNDVRLLYDLLGVKLGDLLIADLVSGVPATPVYQNIFNPFAEDNSSSVTISFPWWNGYYHFNHCFLGNKYYQSKGIKYYLKAMIWMIYVRDYVGVPAVQGNVKRKSTNSTMIDYNSRFVSQKYNKGIETGRAIQWYIHENKSNYDSFNGSYLDFLMYVV